MHLKNQPPVFVPRAYHAELEKVSKAALMDVCWDYAMQVLGEAEAMNELRIRIELIQIYRKRAKEEPRS